MVTVISNIDHLPGEYIKRFGIVRVPFPIHWQGGEFLDGEGKTAAEFLEEVKAIKEFPKTAAVPKGLMRDIWKREVEAGKEVVSIHMGSNLTKATHDILTQLKREISGEIHIFDSLQPPLGTSPFALVAAEMAERGHSAKEIIERLEYLLPRSGSFYMTPDLEYLYRGGRIGKARSLLGSILKIIPVIYMDLEERVLTPLGKARNPHQANAMIIEKIRKDMEALNGEEILLLADHVGDNPGPHGDLLEQLGKEGWKMRVIETEPGCSTIVHTGPGAWEVAYIVL